MAGQKEVLVAATSDIRPLAALLRGLAFASRTTISLSDAGLMFSVSLGRSLLATAYVHSTLFSEYAFTPSAEEDEPTMEVRLGTLLTLLDIFGHAGPMQGVGGGGKGRRWEDQDEEEEREREGGRKATAMRMTWRGTGHPLILHLAGDSPDETTFTELTTFDPEAGALDLPFDHDDTAVKIIMKSTWLAEALSELDPSCTHLTLQCTPPSATQPFTAASRSSQKPAPTFRLRATGNLGTTVMDYPDDKDVLELAEFHTAQPISFTYRHPLLAHSLPALRSSTKTSLRLDTEGLMSLQFLMPFRRKGGGGGWGENYIEFRCVAVVDEE